MDSFDVIVVGEANLDAFLWIHDTNKHFRLDPNTREICIKSGDKAKVDKAYLLVGGNSANVSVGLSRLGFKTAIVAEIGEDEFGQKIINTLKEEGVFENLLKQIPHQPSSFSVIINFQNDRTIFVENVEREHNFSFDNISSKWVYLTSLAERWEDAYRKVLDFVRTNSIKLAFNPGTSQIDMGKDSILEILKNTEILFLNREEGIQICGLSSGADPRDILYSLKNLGPKIAVLTDGTNGSNIMDSDNNISSHKAIDVTVVERTGAGDAYASGFISAVLAGKNYQTAMKWGSENAASVIGKVGATAGLLRIEEMEKKENE